MEHLKESEQNWMENRRKEDLRYVAMASSAPLSPLGMWKRENVPNELMGRAKNICRQNVEKMLKNLLDLCTQISQKYNCSVFSKNLEEILRCHDSLCLKIKLFLV